MASVFLGLTFLSHPTVFFAALSVIPIYALFLGIFQKGNKLKNVFWGLLRVGLVGGTALLLTFFWTFPFYHYSKVAASGDNKGVVTLQNYEIGMDLTKILSFKPPYQMSEEEYFKTRSELAKGDTIVNGKVWERGYIFKNFSFPLGISILYILGIISSVIIWEGRRFSLFLASFLALLAGVSEQLIVFLANLPILGYLASWRSMISPERVYLPIAAAFACYALLVVILSPLKLIVKTKIFEKSKVLFLGKEFVLTVFALVFAGGVLLYFRTSRDLPNPNYLSAYARNVYLRNIWKEPGIPDDLCLLERYKEESHCKDYFLSKYFYPGGIIGFCESEKDTRPKICDAHFTNEDVLSFVTECRGGSNKKYLTTYCVAMEGVWEKAIKDLSTTRATTQLKEIPEVDFPLSPGIEAAFEQIPNNDFIRYDYSPLKASASMVGPYFMDTPQFNSYAHSAYLIRRLAGYEISNFYADDPVYPDPKALPEIANWFGISYFTIAPEKEAEKFEAAGFEKLAEHIYKTSGDNYLLEISNKPKILVIGSLSKRVYDIIFKLAPFGFINYEEAILVKGEEQVDSYTLEELSKFDALILYGYKYRSRQKGWEVLDEYTKNGGNIFIETGWQFESADYQINEDAPNFLPVTSLTWGDLGKTSDYKTYDLASVIDTSEFPPLIWNDLPWGVSLAGGLRQWATPILTAANEPLIARGIYGKGRVVWSGMNLFGHLKGYDHDNEEIALMGYLMDWLLAGKGSDVVDFGSDFSAERKGADRIVVNINSDLDGYGIYLKEANHPWWKARLISGSNSQIPLTIYSAGPFFKYIFLPKVHAGDQVVFYVDKTFIRASWFISILSFILVLIILLKMDFFINYIKGKSLSKFPKKSGIFTDEEKNY